MAIIELYSHRNKPTYPDVYKYNNVSNKLRVQFVNLVLDATDLQSSQFFHEFYVQFKNYPYPWLFETLTHEYGVLNLAGYGVGSEQWFRSHATNSHVEHFLDLVDLTLRIMDKYLRAYKSTDLYNRTIRDHSQKIDDTIQEINERMRRDGFGYEFTDGQLIRVDNQYVHAEVVKPALLILQDFDGAREEFLSAHEHYKHGAYEECIADCNKSFESLMKGICHERGWEYDNTAQAKKLIKTCLDNELIPSYLQEQFAQYLNLLSSGIPTIRNKEAGHGQGNEVKDPAQSLTSYALHLTASNLVFLGECNKALR